jgi:hypothetical protein
MDRQNARKKYSGFVVSRSGEIREQELYLDCPETKRKSLVNR